MKEGALRSHADGGDTWMTPPRPYQVTVRRHSLLRVTGRSECNESSPR